MRWDGMGCRAEGVLLGRPRGQGERGNSRQRKGRAPWHEEFTFLRTSPPLHHPMISLRAVQMEWMSSDRALRLCDGLSNGLLAQRKVNPSFVRNFQPRSGIGTFRMGPT